MRCFPDVGIARRAVWYSSEAGPSPRTELLRRNSFRGDVLLPRCLASEIRAGAMPGMVLFMVVVGGRGVILYSCFLAEQAAALLRACICQAGAAALF
jgi:hypothetical protein